MSQSPALDAVALKPRPASADKESVWGGGKAPPTV
jgi:hypothetical protein